MKNLENSHVSLKIQQSVWKSWLGSIISGPQKRSWHSRCSINFLWVDGFYMSRDRSWTKSTAEWASLGKHQVDCGQLGLRTNHREHQTGIRWVIKSPRMGYLPLVTTRQLADVDNKPLPWPMDATGAHIHCAQQSRCFFTIQSPHRELEANLVPWKIAEFEAWQFWCCHLLGLCPWAHFLNSNLESPH